MLQQRKFIDLSERLFVGRDRAAELLDVSSRFIDLAISRDELPAFKVGKRVLISTADLLVWVGRERA